MSSKKTRAEIVKELDQQVRDNGNANVLMVHAIAQRVGLSASEFECCSLISDHGPFTAGELARRCHITTGGMTGMLDRLERAGFIQRSVDPKDRRRVLVSAVWDDEAAKKVMAMYTPLQKAFDSLVAECTDEQLEFLLDFFVRCNQMFNDTIAGLPDMQAPHAARSL